MTMIDAAAIHGKGEGSRSRGARQTRRIGAAKDDPWWTAQLLKLGEDAAAFERIEQMPRRGKGLVQRAHDLVVSVRNGNPSAREELVIVLQILSDQQDRPKPQKQSKPSLARLVAKAKQLGIDVTVEPNGAATFHTGTASAPVDKPQTELDEWIAKHAH
jgi:hypothetical protein